MAFRHGRYAFSGYTAYRYGEKPTKPTRHDRILKGQTRREIVGSAMNILRNWIFSPFQHEAACVTGLRISLVLGGYAWPRADREAGLIVGEALTLLGAERPTWLEGQPEHMTPREDCRRCGRPLPEEAFDGKRQTWFCDLVCAQAAAQSWRDRHCSDYDIVLRSAKRMIRTSRNPEQDCDQCGARYHVLETTQHQKYCLPRCYAVAKAEARRPFPEPACIAETTSRPRFDQCAIAIRHASSPHTMPGAGPDIKICPTASARSAEPHSSRSGRPRSAVHGPVPAPVTRA